MKVLLISLYNPYSFSVLALHSVLEREGHEVYSVFFKKTTPIMTHIEPSADDIKALHYFIKEYTPNLICLSINTTNYNLAVVLTEKMRKVTKAKIVWGGIHPTIAPEQCIQHADIVCIGEGEGAILELVGYLESGRKISKISNLWIREGREIFKNGVRDLIENLDYLPSMDFTPNNKYLIEDGKVMLASGVEEMTSYATMTTRGCPFGCSFCCNYNLRKIYSGKGNYVRRRSVEHVIKELEKAKVTFPNMKEIRFIDDVFTFDSEWIKQFCGEYKKRIDLPFSCLCHPLKTDDEFIKLLKETGLKSVIIGIQSGSETFRKEHYLRNEMNEDIIKADVVLDRHGINRYYDIILGNPLEKEKDREATLDLILKLSRPFDLHTFNLTHFPNTRMTSSLLEKGLISQEDIEDKKRNTWKGKWCSKLDTRKSKDVLFWECMYYMAQYSIFPKIIIRRISKINIIKRNADKLAWVLKLMSGNIYTVSPESKLDALRMKMIIICNQPSILLKKETWQKILFKRH